MRVLVTDDDEALRSEIVECLERKGLQVEEAADGAEAVSRLAVLRPDVLVMDVHMPEMDGLSVFKQISEAEEGRYPVIIMSADEEEIARARAMGCPIVMKKPFRLASLHAYIEEAAKDSSC
jgi:CheY-like chemotaxis protein